MRLLRAFSVLVLFVCTLCLRPAVSAAAVTGLHSIAQIAGGTTLDFEGVPMHSNPNIPLARYSIATDSGDVTQFVDWVTGNADAPVSKEAVFSPTTFTTITPWSSVGFATLSSLLGPSESFNFAAYDMQHNLIYSDSHLFAPTIDPRNVAQGEPSYNASVFFFGVSSDTPIYTLTLASSNPNYAIDSFTFVNTPEPGCAMLLSATLPLLIVRRR